MENTKMKKQRHSSNPNAEWKTVLQDLPYDILVLHILSRLTSKSIFSFACVSKKMSSITDDRKLMAQQHCVLSNNAAPVEVPRLMYISRVEGQTDRCIMQTRRFVNSYMRKGKSVLDMGVSSDRLCFAFRNLFGFQHPIEQAVVIVNPCRRNEVVMLPTSGITLVHLITGNWNPRGFTECWYGLGINKNTYKLKLVRVIRCRHLVDGELQLEYVVHVLELGEASWHQISSLPQTEITSSKRGMSAHGNVHWLAYTRREGRALISFDFTKEEFISSSIPPSLTETVHLLTYKGALALSATSSTTTHRQIEVWSLKDYERKFWTKDYSVEVDQFCESRALAYGDCGEWEHGIYFYFCRRFGMCHSNVFLDLRSTPVKCFSPVLGKNPTYMVPYTGSLLSLKNCDNLVEASHLIRG